MLLFLRCLLLASFSLSVSANSDLEQTLDTHINSYVQQQDFQGQVLIAKGQELLFERTYGYADIKKQRHNQPQTQFLIGSLTKSFTAVAVMQLWQQGKLDLHKPLSFYLPDLKKSLADKLSLHLLLKQQSGLPRHLEHLVDFEAKDVSSAEILSIINQSTLSFEPGSQYQYSNLNFHLAALVLEQISGKRYGELLSELVFTPLNMPSSGVERLANPAPNRANGYRKGITGINRDENIVSYALGSGDIYATARDLWHWGQGLQQKTYLSAAAKKLLFTPESPEWGSYGYGFRILPYKRAEGIQATGDLIRHGGSMDGFLSNFHYYQQDNLYVIVLANIRPFSIRDLNFELKELVLGRPVGQHSRENME